MSRFVHKIVVVVQVDTRLGVNVQIRWQAGLVSQTGSLAGYCILGLVSRAVTPGHFKQGYSVCIYTLAIYISHNSICMNTKYGKMNLDCLLPSLPLVSQTTGLVGATCPAILLTKESSSRADAMSALGISFVSSKIPKRSEACCITVGDIVLLVGVCTI